MGTRDEPLTPFEVERQLLRLADQLDVATEDLIDAETEFVHRSRESELALAHARGLVTGDGVKRTVQEKEDSALQYCERERYALDLALIAVKASRAQVNNLRTQVDIIRSIGTSVRASMEMT